MKENAPFMSIKDTCTVTGLSQCYLRKNIKKGTIPHIMIGKKAMINIELLLQKLKEDSLCIDHR